MALIRPALSALFLYVTIPPVFSATSVAEKSSEVRKIVIQLKDKGSNVNREEMYWKAWEDAPIHLPYLKALKKKGFRVSVMLKWQNAVSGYAAQVHLSSIRKLKFVKRLVHIPKKREVERNPGGHQVLQKSAVLEPFRLVKADAARAWLQAWNLMPGQGMRIAVIDNGFNLFHTAFRHLIEKEKIRDQWDFVDNNQQAITYRKGSTSHGAMVLSIFSASIEGGYSGIVPFADILLYRAEDEADETYAEEDYVAAAIMRAVAKGTHIINISLAYRYDFNETEINHPYSYFDGKTGPASFAALSAAKRNVIVVVSMGNEGLNHPQEPNIASPADADSILAVGGMQNAEERWSLSSIGPTYDGRIKPDISAPGILVPVVDPATLNDIVLQSGTSFSAPIVAAIAALTWQSHPYACAQTIRHAILASGHLAGNPNNEIGHGLVDAERALFNVNTLISPRCDVLRKEEHFPAHIFSTMPGLLFSNSRIFNLNGQKARAGTSILIKGQFLEAP